MTAMTDHQPDEGFRLSQLIYDKRYRSVTIQTIALILVLLGVGWLLRNAYVNLAAVGQDFNFSFLWQTAGYDIGQTLIPYTSQSTHFEAAVVGLLNTLLVAVLGCIACTIVGVLMGVLRLSPNWIVRNIAGVYIELFRNVPVLLWIILIMAVLTETTAAPRDFRGDDASASMLLWDSVAVTNRGIYVPSLTFGEGSSLVVITFLLSLVAIFFTRRWSRARQMQTGQLFPMLPVGLALLILPTLLAYFVSGGPVGMEKPVLAGFNFQGGLQMRSSFAALWIALSLYTGAFVAENVRAGILSVSKGQSEAAAALGLRPKRVMNLVVLPQALRVIVPPMISNYLNLTKNSSLAIAIGYQDLVGTLGNITRNQTGRELECVLLLMVIYVTISLIISTIGNVYNRSVMMKER